MASEMYTGSMESCNVTNFLTIHIHHHSRITTSIASLFSTFNIGGYLENNKQKIK
ncbi:MAG: hypothetical protein QXZ44_01145 [Ferroplasma sp.]